MHRSVDSFLVRQMSNMCCAEEKHIIIEIRKRILSQRINLVH
jgi:hypothetical protein